MVKKISCEGSFEPCNLILLLTKYRKCKLALDKSEKRRYNQSCVCGRSSSGRARPCQGRGSEFEPRRPLQKRKSHPSGWDFLFGMCRSTGELAASTCAKRVKSRGEAGLLRMARAIRGMPGSEFEPRRPLQKEYPIRQDGIFSFGMRQRAGWKSLPRPARSASNQEVRQGSCEWREPFVGCREASSSLVARSKNTTQRVVFFSLIRPSPPCQEDTK